MTLATIMNQMTMDSNTKTNHNTLCNRCNSCNSNLLYKTRYVMFTNIVTDDFNSSPPLLKSNHVGMTCDEHMNPYSKRLRNHVIQQVARMMHKLVISHSLKKPSS